MTHVVTKFKTLFLRDSVYLPVGKYLASSTHVLHILTSTSKLVHGLTQSDLDNKDKMHFLAFKKITEDRCSPEYSRC